MDAVLGNRIETGGRMPKEQALYVQQVREGGRCCVVGKPTHDESCTDPDRVVDSARH